MQILKMIKNRLHTKDKKMEYIKRLALENTERKKQIEKLTSQLEELSEHCKEMAETVDNFKRYSDSELSSMVEGMIDEKLPCNLDEICDAYDSYDFDDFVTMDTLEDELDKMVTQDRLDEAFEDFGNEFEGRIGDKLQDDIIQSRVEYELEAQVNSLDFEKIFKDECPALVNTVIAQMCVKLSSTINK